MAAVYELATVKPFVPNRRSYNAAEWPIYGEGYYQALAAALRVLKLVGGRAEPEVTTIDYTEVINVTVQDVKDQRAELDRTLSALSFAVYVLIVIVLLDAVVTLAWLTKVATHAAQ